MTTRRRDMLITVLGIEAFAVATSLVVPVLPPRTGGSFNWPMDLPDYLRSVGVVLGLVNSVLVAIFVVAYLWWVVAGRPPPDAG